MKMITRVLVVFVILIATSTMLNAQIPPPPPPGGAGPLDPISWILLGAGGAMAGKKYYDKRKED